MQRFRRLCSRSMNSSCGRYRADHRGALQDSAGYQVLKAGGLNVSISGALFHGVLATSAVFLCAAHRAGTLSLATLWENTLLI